MHTFTFSAAGAREVKIVALRRCKGDHSKTSGQWMGLGPELRPYQRLELRPVHNRNRAISSFVFHHYSGSNVAEKTDTTAQHVGIDPGFTPSSLLQRS
jgi:hypothetical protein